MAQQAKLELDALRKRMEEGKASLERSMSIERESFQQEVATEKDGLRRELDEAMEALVSRLVLVPMSCLLVHALSLVVSTFT